MDWYKTFESCLLAGHTITSAAERSNVSRARAYQVWTTNDEWGGRFDDALSSGKTLQKQQRREANSKQRRKSHLRRLSRNEAVDDARKKVVDEEMEWLLSEYLIDHKISPALSRVGMAFSTLYRRLKTYPDWAERFSAEGYVPRHRTRLSRGEL